MHAWLEAIEKMEEEFGACAHYYVGNTIAKIRLRSRKVIIPKPRSSYTKNM